MIGVGLTVMSTIKLAGEFSIVIWISSYSLDPLPTSPLDTLREIATTHPPLWHLGDCPDKRMRVKGVWHWANQEGLHSADKEQLWRPAPSRKRP